MTPYYTFLALFTFLPIASQAQTVQDDFEGNGNITNWYGDDCGINTNRTNPFQQGINNSASPPPRYRSDFNRVVIPVNGENNTDGVLAYLDDFYYDASSANNPVFDKLVWSDEFDGNGAIDDTKWFHQTQLPAIGGWHNGERQHYTNRMDNSFVENGRLKIVAKKETFTDQGYTKQYTSARLNSKFAFQYGRVEIRAKLPTGGGTWPALWTLGKNITENGAYWETQGFGTTSWPACGEIDLMEHWGHNQNYVQSAIHTPSSFGGTINIGGQVVPTASSDFHVYAMEWTPEQLVFSVDGQVHYFYNPSIKDANTWPFDAEQYLLLNIAIEQSIDPNFTQSSMEVDYVRVYQEQTVAIGQLEKDSPPIYYPNPVKDALQITLEQTAETTILFKIYNLEGQLIQTYLSPINNKIVQLNNLDYLTSGLYWVSYKVGGKNYCLKFVKQ